MEVGFEHLQSVADGCELMQPMTNLSEARQVFVYVAEASGSEPRPYIQRVADFERLQSVANSATSTERGVHLKKAGGGAGEGTERDG